MGSYGKSPANQQISIPPVNHHQIIHLWHPKKINQTHSIGNKHNDGKFKNKSLSSMIPWMFPPRSCLLLLPTSKPFYWNLNLCWYVTYHVNTLFLHMMCWSTGASEAVWGLLTPRFGGGYGENPRQMSKNRLQQTFFLRMLNGDVYGRDKGKH